MKGKSKKSTYSTTFGIDPTFGVDPRLSLKSTDFGVDPIFTPLHANLNYIAKSLQRF